MLRVLIQTEDRTGGGLEKLVQRAVQRRLIDAGLPPVWFPNRSRSVRGNADLVKRCRLYGHHRFNERFDHVVYVIDAKEGWRLVGLPGPSGDIAEYLADLGAALRAKMTQEARGSRTDEDWTDISAGFHPHVLVWERESLMVPVSDALKLGAPADAYDVRGAAAWVGERQRTAGRGKYDKAVDGPIYLKQIAADPVLLDRVLESNPSVRGIVDDLFEAVARQQV